jgi:hypothetical protein
MLNLNGRCSIMWELKMSTRTSRMCFFFGLIGEIVMLKWTKQIYFVRCVRKHYDFEWFLLSCKLLIEWLWTKVHCRWQLLEDIKITWPTNWRRTLSQTLIPLVIASISLLLQKLEWWRMEMTSKIALLELVHYPTKKFEYRNQIETIHIIIKYM